MAYVSSRIVVVLTAKVTLVAAVVEVEVVVVVPGDVVVGLCSMV